MEPMIGLVKEDVWVTECGDKGDISGIRSECLWRIVADSFIKLFRGELERLAMPRVSTMLTIRITGSEKKLSGGLQMFRVSQS